MTLTVQGVRLPDSKLAQEITELVRDTESLLLIRAVSIFLVRWPGSTGT
jgi:hypothetical protein